MQMSNINIETNCSGLYSMSLWKFISLFGKYISNREAGFNLYFEIDKYKRLCYGISNENLIKYQLH